MELLPFAISPWREPVCVGHEKVEITDMMASLTVPVTAFAGTLEYEDGPVVIRLDATLPVAATHPLRFDRDRDTLALKTLRDWRAIRSGSINGAVRVTYYRW